MLPSHGNLRIVEPSNANLLNASEHFALFALKNLQGRIKDVPVRVLDVVMDDTGKLIVGDDIANVGLFKSFGECLRVNRRDECCALCFGFGFRVHVMCCGVM